MKPPTDKHLAPHTSPQPADEWDRIVQSLPGFGLRAAAAIAIEAGLAGALDASTAAQAAGLAVVLADAHPPAPLVSESVVLEAGGSKMEPARPGGPLALDNPQILPEHLSTSAHSDAGVDALGALGVVRSMVLSGAPVKHVLAYVDGYLSGVEDGRRMRAEIDAALSRHQAAELTILEPEGTA